MFDRSFASFSYREAVLLIRWLNIVRLLLNDLGEEQVTKAVQRPHIKIQNIKVHRLILRRSEPTVSISIWYYSHHHILREKLDANFRVRWLHTSTNDIISHFYQKFWINFTNFVKLTNSDNDCEVMRITKSWSIFQILLRLQCSSMLKTFRQDSLRSCLWH